MGIYINKGNSGFRQIRNSEYIDKSGLIGVVNQTLFTEQKFTCVTRCRRFGKSMAAKMLAAYYDHSCDSRPLLADLQIAGNSTFEEHLNKYPVIYLDMTTFITSFGDENKNLYEMSELDDSMLLNFSINRNRIYALERARKCGSAETDEKIVKVADRSWFAEWPQSKRDSNIYASLSVRSKLLMMGLDFEKKKEGASYLSYDEYMKWYAGDDLPEITGNMKDGHGSATRRGADFKNSRAYNMAFQEHLRWNAYMMSCGTVPADKETILNEKNSSGKYTNGNNYEMRHHGNLTDFDGLREFAKMIAKRDNISEEKADVILYDYQLLDDAWWILDEMGYGIYEIA